MTRIALFIVTMFASAAFAANCPVQMKAIDEALPKAKLDAAKTAEVKKLRTQLRYPEFELWRGRMLIWPTGKQ